MGNKAKKQKISYKNDVSTKAEELEKELFGGLSDPLSLFTVKENKEVLSIKNYSDKHAGQVADEDLFFVDKDGEDDDDNVLPVIEAFNNDADDSSSSDEEDSEDEKVESASDAAEGEEASQSSSSDENEDEEEVDSDKEEEKEKVDVKKSTAKKAVEAPVAKKAPKKSAAVWEDPDEKSMRIDVAGNSRLRKLRKNDRQKEMSGKEFESALRRQHQMMNPRTSWAATAAAENAARRSLSAKRTWADDGEEGKEEGSEGEEGEDAAAFLRRAGGVLAVDGDGRLPQGTLETTRLRDANQVQRGDSVVRSVQFLPGGAELLLTAGLDRRLRLFGVDGVTNPLVQSVFIEDMPVWQASFVASSPSTCNGAVDAPSSSSHRGTSVIMTGRRPFFYLYDLEAARVERCLGPRNLPTPLKTLERFAAMGPGACRLANEPLVAFHGDQGYIPLMSLRTRQAVASVKLNSGRVNAAAFAEDGVELWSAGNDGLVNVWDLRMTRQCRLQLRDSGNLGGGAASLAVSPDGRYVATGGRSGIVNVYSRAQIDAAVAAAPYPGAVSTSPLRELTNLVTSVDSLVFSPDSQMLLLSSRLSRDALRVAHVPSMTVFSNWPSGKTPLGQVQCADVSAGCGMIAIGNAKGRALLYRLNHYSNAGR